jgi:hypothetical protein
MATVAPSPASTTKPDNRFHDKCGFQDEILGLGRLSEVEKDLVDSPEFQRLFRISQLGFVDLVYQCANHTRGIHSIGCCFWAKRLVKTLNENAARSGRQQPIIGEAETALISIGALLHDISHGPYAHDIEKKSHEIFPRGRDKEKLKIKSGYGPYEKHDDYEKNPILFITLLNPELSVLARILWHHSPAFWRLLKKDAQQYAHLKAFVDEAEAKWENREHEILPHLLFHLLVFEKIDFAMEESNFSIQAAVNFDNEVKPWGIGPVEARKQLHRLWYQPFRHDIIGDTLSADLLDYLHRDLRRLGIPKGLDLKLLEFYVMVPAEKVHPHVPQEAKDLTRPVQSVLIEEPRISPPVRYRCAINIHDSKRGMFRMETLNELFRLLDLRQEIHEKAVFHRVVQSAIAMLSRAIQILPAQPDIRKLYGFGADASPALFGEDNFLDILIAEAKKHEVRTSNSHLITQSLPQKLAERRIYRPLLVIPGDRMLDVLKDLPGVPELHSPEDGEREKDNKHIDLFLREIAAITDSLFFKAFLSLISRYLDDYLQHSITEGDIAAELGRMESDEQQLEDALNKKKPPKHVIFWATPYKQLYKDPAIVVCMKDDRTATIDELKSLAGIDPSLQERVRAAMDDSEAKYAALWKLYVFLSDGLFYSGSLAKVMNTKCADSREAHIEHLKYAQIIAIRALRCAWGYWRSYQKKEKKPIDLNIPMSLEQLRTVLNRFNTDVSREEADFFSELRNNVAAGDVAQYSHAEGATGHMDGQCRDVRYKYDLRPFTKFDEALALFTLLPETSRLIKQILLATRRKPEAFGREELFEIISRLSESPRRLAACFTAAKGPNAIAARDELLPNLIQEIWRYPDAERGLEQVKAKK